MTQNSKPQKLFHGYLRKAGLLPSQGKILISATPNRVTAIVPQALGRGLFVVVYGLKSIKVY